MRENTERGKAAIIIRNENGETMELIPRDGSNKAIAFTLEEAGILTEKLSKHLGCDF